MDLVWPVTEVREPVESRRTIVICNLALDSVVGFKIRGANVDFLYQIVRHCFLQDEDSILLPRLELLFGEVYTSGWRVGRGGVGRASVGMTIRKSKEEE